MSCSDCGFEILRDKLLLKGGVKTGQEKEEKGQSLANLRIPFKYSFWKEKREGIGAKQSKHSWADKGFFVVVVCFFMTSFSPTPQKGIELFLDWQVWEVKKIVQFWCNFSKTLNYYFRNSSPKKESFNHPPFQIVVFLPWYTKVDV